MFDFYRPDDFYIVDDSPLPNVDWDRIIYLFPRSEVPRAQLKVEWGKLFGNIHLVLNNDLLDVLQTILRNGIPVDAPTSAGETALQVAHKLGYYSAARLLVRCGADTRKCRCWNDRVCDHPAPVVPSSRPSLFKDLEPFLKGDVANDRLEMRRNPLKIVNHLERMLRSHFPPTSPSERRAREGFCSHCYHWRDCYESSKLKKSLEGYGFLSFNYGFLERCKACAEILSKVPREMTWSREIFDRTPSFLKPGTPDLDIECLYALSKTQPDSNSGSPSAFDTAAYWLLHCLKSHAQCGDNTSERSSQLPSRIIQVGSIRSTQLPKLVDSLPGEKGVYCTLSYRWDNNQLTTTRENLERYKEAIPIQGLYAPFRDAIAVAKGLGIPYLWVDALCICQDNEEEKQREIAKMHHIYHNSILTISAINGALFVERDGNACRSKRRIRPSGPPDTRGWVLQEQVLSRRMLSYADGELFWNCLELRASEGAPIGGSGSENDDEWGEKKVNNARLALAHYEEIDPSIGLLWKGLMEAFSVRHLSKTSDRQSAILGLASVYEEGHGVKVVAGLLNEGSHRFAEHLCWWVLRAPEDWLWASQSPPKAKIASSFKRPDSLEFLAPTWSWLSVLGPVSYQDIGIPYSEQHARKEDEEDEHRDIRFQSDVEIREIMMNDSPSASAISGSIVLTGLLTKARIRHSVTGSLFHWNYKEALGDCLLLGLEDSDVVPSGELSLWPGPGSLWSQWYPDIEPPSCHEIFCLFLGLKAKGPETVRPRRGRIVGPRSEACSLCLVQKGPSDVFERIGLCRWYPHEGSERRQTITIV